MPPAFWGGVTRTSGAWPPRRATTSMSRGPLSAMARARDFGAPRPCLRLWATAGCTAADGVAGVRESGGRAGVHVSSLEAPSRAAEAYLAASGAAVSSARVEDSAWLAERFDRAEGQLRACRGAGARYWDLQVRAAAYAASLDGGCGGCWRVLAGRSPRLLPVGGVELLSVGVCAPRLCAAAEVGVSCFVRGSAAMSEGREGCQLGGTRGSPKGVINDMRYDAQHFLWRADARVEGASSERCLRQVTQCIRQAHSTTAHKSQNIPLDRPAFPSGCPSAMIAQLDVSSDVLVARCQRPRTTLWAWRGASLGRAGKRRSLE